MKTFLLVGGGPKGLDAKLLPEWGFKVICFDLTENIKKYYDNLSKADSLHEIKYAKDYGAIIALAKDVYSKTPFICAVSFTEWGLMPTAYINDSLNLHGNSVEAVGNTYNKLKMRRILQESGLSSNNFEEVKTESQLEKFCKLTNYKCVVKDPTSAGKEGIFIIRKKEDFDRFRQESLSLLSKLGVLLVEEFVDGAEYSIESFSWDGEIKFLTYTKRTSAPPYNAEIGHAMPAVLSDNQKNNIKNFVDKCLQALGVGYGVCHSEIIVGDRSLYFVETHTRPGGDYIYDMVLMAHDVDLIRIACCYASGKKVAIKPKYGKSAAVRFFNPGEGYYKEIKGIELLKDNVLVKDYNLELPEDGFIKEVKENLAKTNYVLVSDDLTSVELEQKLDKIVEGILFV